MLLSLFFFFFNDTATTEIYTLSLHDALPISRVRVGRKEGVVAFKRVPRGERQRVVTVATRVPEDVEPARLGGRGRTLVEVGPAVVPALLQIFDAEINCFRQPSLDPGAPVEEPRLLDVPFINLK